MLKKFSLPEIVSEAKLDVELTAACVEEFLINISILVYMKIESYEEIIKKKKSAPTPQPARKNSPSQYFYLRSLCKLLYPWRRRLHLFGNFVL